MKLKDRIKTYNFWVSLASAILLVINALGQKFNFSFDEKVYNDLFTSFCGILVLLGIIVPPSSSQSSSLKELGDELNQLNLDTSKKLDCESKLTDSHYKCESEKEEVKNINKDSTSETCEDINFDDKIDSSNDKDSLQSLESDDSRSENISQKID